MKRDRGRTHDTTESRKREKSSPRLDKLFDLDSIDGDCFMTILSYLGLVDLKNIMSSSRFLYESIQQSSHVWNELAHQYGMRIEKSNPTSFKNRYTSWKDFYGSINVSQSPSLDLRNVLTHPRIMNAPEWIENPQSLQSSFVYRDWSYIPGNRFMYLWSTKGVLSSVTPTYELKTILDHPSLSDYEILEYRESCKTGIFQLESTLAIVHEVVIFILHVLDFLILADFVYLIRFEMESVILERIDLKTKNCIKLRIKTLNMDDRMIRDMVLNGQLSSQVIDAAICIEDQEISVAIDGILCSFTLDLVPVSKIDFPIKTGFQNHVWVSPIDRLAKYNGTFVFRVATKDNMLVSWKNPVIYQFNSSGLRKIEETIKETSSLYWNLATLTGSVVVHDIYSISSYSLDSSSHWIDTSMEFSKLLESQDKMIISSLTTEICGDLLFAYYQRDGDHAGCIYCLKTGKNLSSLSVSRNFKRVTTRGIITFDNLEFARESDLIL